MKRGGYRPGAGRPKGARNRPKSIMPAFEPVPAVISAGVTPLEYMLSVMRDGDADPTRRDRMAIAAAPFCHSRIVDNRFGKRDATAEQAKVAGLGTEWSRDLEFEDRPN